MTTIYVEHEAWQKMSTLARLCTHEVSGLMAIDIDGDGDVIVTDAFMLKQSGTGASTHLDMDAVIAFYAEDAKKHTAKLKEGEVSQTDKIGWFHSHPGSGHVPSYSSTDVTTLKDLAEATKGAPRPFFVGLVFDSSGQHAKGYIRMAAPISLNLEAEVKQLAWKAEEIEKWAKKELKDKVVAKTPTPLAGKSSTHSNPTGTSGGARNGIAMISTREGLTDYIVSRMKQGSEFYNVVEGCSYHFVKENGLFIPEPPRNGTWAGGALVAHDPKDLPPRPILRWSNDRPWMLCLRPDKLPHVKASKEEKNARANLTEIAKLGQSYLVPYPQRANTCFHCNVPSYELNSGQVLCMLCERMEGKCACDEISLEGYLVMFAKHLSENPNNQTPEGTDETPETDQGEQHTLIDIPAGV